MAIGQFFTNQPQKLTEPQFQERLPRAYAPNAVRLGREHPPDAEREKPDLETCTEGYARRFAGATGEWFLEVQAQATLQMLSAHPGARVLDVGGGHGQLAAPLVRSGYAVTVLGSEPVCSGRISDLLGNGTCRFTVSDIQCLPFPDRSFDVVASYRTLAHLVSWKTLLAEMARVARTAIILDFPASRSLNSLTPQLFGLKKRIEGNTRPYSVIRETDLVATAAELGFQPADRYPEFLLPMVAHRALGRQNLSQATEHSLRLLGLTARFGSPVIMKFTRGGI